MTEPHQVQAVASSAILIARQTSKSKRELADLLAGVAQVLAGLSTEIVRVEDLVDHVRNCNQAGCDEPSAYVVTLPGREAPDGICAAHAPRAREVYRALACHLEFTPAAEWKPALGGNVPPL